MPYHDENQNQTESRDKRIIEMGQVSLNGSGKSGIHLLSIIGEIEGHENLPSGSKTTKYEHVLPELAYVEDSPEIDGLLLLENSMGGDCSAGLAIAEMIASLSKPTVSLVIGDSHSIGVPLAVAADYSFIVPSGTMVIHPVRMSGTVIGAPQTYDYIKIIQDRIVRFIADHSKIKEERLEELMMETGMLTKDVGTILVGEEAVKEGIICEIGGISQALSRLKELIDKRK
ncbi:MAG: ATP-dependent Clp protease proteolytic subunit [Lachnospiraceae bacterium]|nr:ATP-dependent Clp protease proteolytic subunit [Lachnospiraceae bacterium]